MLITASAIKAQTGGGSSRAGGSPARNQESLMCKPRNPELPTRLNLDSGSRPEGQLRVSGRGCDGHMTLDGVCGYKLAKQSLELFLPPIARQQHMTRDSGQNQ